LPPVALHLLTSSDMPDPNEPDEEVRKKVVYEHVASSGTSRNMIVAIVIIVVIALILVGYIFMHIRR